MVSSDAAIGIAFGLISTIISLLGALLAYLTLRAAIHEHQARNHEVVAADGPVRHEHLHLVAQNYVPRPPSDRELRWRR